MYFSRVILFCTNINLQRFRLAACNGGWVASHCAAAHKVTALHLKKGYFVVPLRIATGVER